MKFTDAYIGGRLLETITAGLYNNNLNCLREYVQNSIDAGAKNIEIYFENGNQNLIILDDGAGMSREDLAKKALSIGKSDKTEKNAGWRGLGIWSGVPACERIVIITKKKNDGKYRIQINNNVLRKEYWSNKPVLDILSNATGEIDELDLGKDDPPEGTMVRLESILQPQKNIFNDKAISSYLSRVVPAPFNREQFSFAPKIDEWLRKFDAMPPTANIKFQGKNIFRPPFESDIFFDNVIKNEFKVKDKLIAVGWFLTHNENEVLKEPNRGIYFKKKGFTIGDDKLVLKQFNGTSYNPWQYGEIHIVSEELRENAGRDDFEYDNMIIYPFFEQIGEFISELQKQNRYQSKKIGSKYINKAKKYLENGDVRSAKKEVDKINGRLASAASFPTEASLQSMKPLMDAKCEKDKNEATKLEKEIKQTTPNDIKQIKDQLDALIENLPAPVKKSIRKRSKHGQLDPEMSITDPIKEILKEKTGLDDNEILRLSMAAYGWKEVTPGKDPILTVDPLLSIEDKRAARNRRFGVFIYTVHDLFVNLFKHEKGKDSFKWFEDTTEEEKYKLRIEMYAVIGLIYRLIEKSERYQH